MKVITVLNPDTESTPESPLYITNELVVVSKDIKKTIERIDSSRIFEMPNGTNLFCYYKGYPQSRIRTWMEGERDKGYAYNIVRKRNKATCVLLQNSLHNLSIDEIYCIRVKADNFSPLFIDGTLVDDGSMYYINVTDEFDPNENFNHPPNGDGKIYKVKYLGQMQDSQGGFITLNKDTAETVLQEWLDILSIDEDSQFDVKYIIEDDLHEQIANKTTMSHSTFNRVLNLLKSESQRDIEIAVTLMAEHNFEKSAYWYTWLDTHKIRKSNSLGLSHNKLLKSKLNEIYYTHSISDLYQNITRLKYHMNEIQKQHAINAFNRMAYDLVIRNLNYELNGRFSGREPIVDPDQIKIFFDKNILSLGDSTVYNFEGLDEPKSNDTEAMGNNQH